VFWSGGPAARLAAEAWAEAHGGITISQTAAGKALTALDNLGLSKYTGGLWEKLSAKFAKGAEGEIQVFLGKTLRPKNTWESIEKPILEKKGNTITNHLIKPYPDTTTSHAL
jgi:hypothetical protein